MLCRGRALRREVTMVGNNDISVALIEPMTGVKEGTLPLMVSAPACICFDAQDYSYECSQLQHAVRCAATPVPLCSAALNWAPTQSNSPGAAPLLPCRAVYTNNVEYPASCLQPNMQAASRNMWSVVPMLSTCQPCAVMKDWQHACR